MELEYKVLKEILAEQKKTNELLESILKGGNNHGNGTKLYQEQSQSADTRKPITNNNSTGNKRGPRKP